MSPFQPYTLTLALGGVILLVVHFIKEFIQTYREEQQKVRRAIPAVSTCGYCTKRWVVQLQDPRTGGWVYVCPQHWEQLASKWSKL